MGVIHGVVIFVGLNPESENLEPMRVECQASRLELQVTSVKRTSKQNSIQRDGNRNEGRIMLKLR